METNDQQDLVNSSNPYQSAASDPSANVTTASVSLVIAAWLAILACVVTLGFWILGLLMSVWLPPHTISISLAGYVGMFMIFPGIGLAGAISMLRGKRYWLAMLGACSLLVPVLGALLGLAFPVGIWAIVLLCQAKVRQSFAA